MNRAVVLPIAILLLAAGVITLVTAASMSRRRAEPLAGPAGGGPRGASPVDVQVRDVRPTAQADTADDPLAADWLTEWTLTERNGRPFSSRDLAGQVHVVNFFFASCPSYCRMQSTEVEKLARVYGPQGVVFLSITCDPEVDTPLALQRYARLYNADPQQWLFLTGDLLLLRRVGAEMYQLAVDRQTHSEHLVVIDRWGQNRGRYRWRNHPEELAELKKVLNECLAESEPPVPGAAENTAGDDQEAVEPDQADGGDDAVEAADENADRRDPPEEPAAEAAPADDSSPPAGAGR